MEGLSRHPPPRREITYQKKCEFEDIGHGKRSENIWSGKRRGLFFGRRGGGYYGICWYRRETIHEGGGRSIAAAPLKK